LHQCIRAGFKDDTNYADRAGDFIKFKAFVQFGGAERGSDGVRQGNETVDAFANFLNFALVKLKAFHERQGEIFLAGFLEVELVFPNNGFGLFLQGVSNASQRVVFLR